MQVSWPGGCAGASGKISLDSLLERDGTLNGFRLYRVMWENLYRSTTWDTSIAKELYARKFDLYMRLPKAIVEVLRRTYIGYGFSYDKEVGLKRTHDTPQGLGFDFDEVIL